MDRSGADSAEAASRPRRILIAAPAPSAGIFASYLRAHGFLVDVSERARPDGYDLVLAPPGAAHHGPASAGQGKIILYRGREREAALGALERGADDIFPCEGSARELLARVRSVLRRCSRSWRARGLWTACGYVVDEGRRSVRQSNGQAIDLSPREFALFRALARRPGVVVSRGELIDTVLGADSDVFDRTIDCLVSRLRRRLASGSGRDPITTHRGSGYAFAEPVADQARR